MTLLEEGTDDQNNKIITSTELTKLQISLMKDLKDFIIFLTSDQSTHNDIANVTKAHFEEWQLERILQGPTVVPPTPATPGTPAGGAPPPPPPANTTPGIDITRQIAAIDKFEAKNVPKFDGSIGGSMAKSQKTLSTTI